MNLDLIVWGSDLPPVMQRYLDIPVPSIIPQTNITPPNKGVVLGSTIFASKTLAAEYNRP